MHFTVKLKAMVSIDGMHKSTVLGLNLHKSFRKKCVDWASI